MKTNKDLIIEPNAMVLQVLLLVGRQKERL